MAEEDIRRLLVDLDKLEVAVKEGRLFQKKPAEKGAPSDTENDLSETEKMLRRKEELKQLIEVLETEFRESSISEKTYKEAVNKSKEELLKIEYKLNKISSGEEKPEVREKLESKDGKGGRMLELEKMKIDMQNQVNNLTLQFSKAEISDEDYKKKTHALKKQIDEIDGEISRLDKGKSVVEAVPMGEVPKEKPDEGVITQTIEGVTEDGEGVEEEPDAEKKKEQPEAKKKKQKKKFSIRSKLFGEKEKKDSGDEEEKKDSGDEEEKKDSGDEEDASGGDEAVSEDDETASGDDETAS